MTKGFSGMARNVTLCRNILFVIVCALCNASTLHSSARERDGVEWRIFEQLRDRIISMTKGWVGSAREG